MPVVEQMMSAGCEGCGAVLETMRLEIKKEE
jgi:hypothetical protein